MNLSERLMKIVSLVPRDSIVADIGTDHGYIPVYLIQNKISKLVIASDISPSSLDKAIDYVKDNKLEDSIKTRLGNGLEVFKPFEVDTAIFAGMGGLLIQEILEEDKAITDSISYFIFQPMVASTELRKYLFENKFKIVDEELAQEGKKFYEIILAKKGLDYVENEIDFDISPKLIEKKHPLLKDFIVFKANLLESIVEKIGDRNTERSNEKLNEIKATIRKYKEVLMEIEG